MKDFNLKKDSKKKPAGRGAVIMLKALECIAEVAMSAVDFSTAFLDAGYGASVSRLDYLMQKNSNARMPGPEKALDGRHRQLLYRLRRDGLVREATKKGIKQYFLTAKGFKRKANLAAQLSETLIEREYSVVAVNDFIIVSFDISERERRKRNWLRDELRQMEFSMIQQSIWIGKIKIPKEFLEDLKRYDLVEQVEIFEAKKLGTLSSE